MSSEKRFTVEGKDYFIKTPDINVLTESQSVYTRSFRKACDDGAILKKTLDKHMRDQGLWDDSIEEKYQALVKESADIEYKIKSGQYKKASEIRKNALRLKEVRAEILELLSDRNAMDSLTAEGIADQTRFNFLLASCVYDYATQKPVFKDLADYLNRSSEPFAMELASKFASQLYGLSENYEDEFFENKVLKKLNCIDDKGFLINADGHRVDIDGNLVDDSGARIDADGNRIDINNNPILDDSVLDDLVFEDDLRPQEPTKRKTRSQKE